LANTIKALGNYGSHKKYENIYKGINSRSNPRIGMMYNLWRKMKSSDKAALLEQANYYLQNIEDL